MPRLTPRAIAYDRVQGRVVVLAQAKKKHLLQLDRAGNIEAVRSVPAPSETFWIAGPTQQFAVFWSNAKLSPPSGFGFDNGRRQPSLLLCIWNWERRLICETVCSYHAADRRR
ncbi:hypothetical protein ACFL6C_05415 [Myxococcota bacterium]